jgi:predicted DsbA family dithiol-disulfide isomerase
MKIEIWSDVACPFCYIGKRRLEEALSQFEHSNEVEIEWKSYLLNPDQQSNTGQSLYEYLAEAKGWTMEYTMQVNEQVLAMAEEVGLHYNMDKAVIANTSDAHRLIQHAKSLGKGDDIEEALFKAYFVDGRNLADHQELTQIAVDCGIEEASAAAALNNMEYSEAVQRDIYEGVQIGVKGVPFFVFDNKYGISGAQPLEVFTRTLQQTYEAKASL